MTEQWLDLITLRPSNGQEEGTRMWGRLRGAECTPEAARLAFLGYLGTFMPEAGFPLQSPEGRNESGALSNQLETFLGTNMPVVQHL